MSDAYAFEELAASTTSESLTVPSLGLVPLGECRLASDDRATPDCPEQPSATCIELGVTLPARGISSCVPKLLSAQGDWDRLEPYCT